MLRRKTRIRFCKTYISTEHFDLYSMSQDEISQEEKRDQGFQVFNTAMDVRIHSSRNRFILEFIVDLFSKLHITMNYLIDGNHIRAMIIRDNIKPRMPRVNHSPLLES